MPRTSLSPAEALHARAGRAHEDPYAMTTDALMQRLGEMIFEVIALNPYLGKKETVKAARLKLKAEMAMRAQQSARARRERAGLDASGLLDAGSDSIDA